MAARPIYEMIPTNTEIQFEEHPYIIEDCISNDTVKLRSVNDDSVIHADAHAVYAAVREMERAQIVKRLHTASTVGDAVAAFDMAVAQGQRITERQIMDAFEIGQYASLMTENPSYGELVIEEYAKAIGLSPQSVRNYRLIHRTFRSDDFNQDAIDAGARYGHFLEAYRYAAAMLVTGDIQTSDELRYEAEQRLNWALDAGLTVSQMKAGLDGSGPMSSVGSTNGAVLTAAQGDTVTLSLPAEFVNALRPHLGKLMRVKIDLANMPESDDDE